MTFNVSNPKFWNDKYLDNKDNWDISFPTPAFVNFEESIPRKSKILIPGCGRGYDALYLASKGHYVDALDFSEFATNFLLSKISGLEKNINVINENFFNMGLYYNGSYDYIFEYTFYCAINPSRRLDYVKKSYDLLCDKGQLIGLFLPIKTKSKNLGPPYQVDPKSLLLKFQNYFNIKIIKDFESIPQRKNNEFLTIMIKNEI